MRIKFEDVKNDVEAYSPYNDNGVITVVAWNHNIYPFYKENMWAYDQNDNNMIIFDDSRECINWINDNIKPQYIDSEYLTIPKYFFK